MNRIRVFSKKFGFFQKGMVYLCSVALTMLCFSFPLTITAEVAQAKISPDLLQRMNETVRAETFPVIVWINDIQYDEQTVAAQANTAVSIIKDSNATVGADRSGTEDVSALLCSGDDPANLNDTQLYIEAKRKIVSDMYVESNAAIKRELLAADKTIDSNQVAWVSEYSPVIKMSLSKSQIVALSKNSAVEGIYLDDYEPVYDEDSFESVTALENGNSRSEYNIWQETINVPYVRNLGYDGTGVKVGLVDSGVVRYEDLPAGRKSVLQTLYSEGRLIDDPDAPTGEYDHAYAGALVIAATDGTVPGIAPGVTLYSSSGRNRANGYFGAIEWAVSKGCRIISFAISFEGAYNSYDVYSKWIDHIAIQHDVTVVKSAGNEGGTGTPMGGMSYNAIVVGASDDKNTTNRRDDVRRTDSSYYTGSVLAIKPDIMAPGEGIAVSGGYFYQTSAATPQVAAITALMYQMRPALESNQAITKAILLAGISPCGGLSGTSVAGGTTTAMLAQSGAGVVDAKAMRYVTQNNRFVGGTLHAGGSYRKTFTVSSSDTLTRVALTWLKNNRVTGSHTADSPNVSDADCAMLYLKVTSPSGVVYRSQCNRGNVQLISFDPTETGTYTIDVTVQEASADESNIYYGLAWY